MGASRGVTSQSLLRIEDCKCFMDYDYDELASYPLCIPSILSATMSGRSAYVRKKINDPKAAEKATAGSGRGRQNSVGGGRPSSRSDYGAQEQPQSPGTGYGTTNARLLKFSEPAREDVFSSHPFENTAFANQVGDHSQSGSNVDRGDAHIPRHQGPMPDFAYARVRKPVLKTEDISGIERSGFRSAVDKKSEEVRKGITKAFTFGSKKKKMDSDVDLRSPSSAGSRGIEDYGHHAAYNMDDTPSFAGQFPHPTPSAVDMEHYYLTSPPPSTKLPPIPQPSGPPIKRWSGAGRPVQRWNKLRKDPELWDPNGDVLVYFAHKGQSPRPTPSFRLSSHIIEATESRFLITLLREGFMDDDDIHMQKPSSPIGVPPMASRRSSTHFGPGYGQVPQPTPPISDDVSFAGSDGQISYEMFFPGPSTMTRTDAHRYAITTRNIFALLYHASLVGFTLYQALSDLLGRLESYMSPDADNVGTIINYLSARGIDDPRNDPETAVSILAWSEMPDVRWEEGWRESFVHCAGIYPRLEHCADFKSLAPITRALLERAYLETQLRVQSAEERLAGFTYVDVWPASGPVGNSPGRAAADRLQKFLVAHYTALYGTWPPPKSSPLTYPSSHVAGTRTQLEGEEPWLTRTVAQKLLGDFGALYDYLVNRDIVWDENEFRSGRKWEMISESGNKSFSADSPDLPLTDLLIEFDNRLRYPHIPHPYPLVPESIPPLQPPLPSREKIKKADRDRDRAAAANSSVNERNLERRVQLAYTEATNIYTLGSDFAHSELIDSFARFEKTNHVGSVDPFTARLGRWVLVYGILQTLATISVDHPCVRYRDRDGAGVEVSYHLCTRLKGSANSAKIPPWKTNSAAEPPDPTHELSYCWTVPAAWRRQPDDGSGSEPGYERTNEGSSRRKTGSPYSNDGDESNYGGGSGGGYFRYRANEGTIRTSPMMRSQIHKFPNPPGTQSRSPLQTPPYVTTSINHLDQYRSPTSGPRSPSSVNAPWDRGNAQAHPGIYTHRERSDDTEPTVFSSHQYGADSNNNETRSPRSRALLSPIDISPRGDEMRSSARTHRNMSERESPSARRSHSALPLSQPRSTGPKGSMANASSSLESMMAAVERESGNGNAGVQNVGIAMSSDDAEFAIVDEDYFPHPPPRRRGNNVGAAAGDSYGVYDRPALHHRESSDALGSVIDDLKALDVIIDEDGYGRVSRP